MSKQNRNKRLKEEINLNNQIFNNQRKKCLNIGCGPDLKKNNNKEDWINLDFNKTYNPEVIHDIDVFPYPFRDNYFDKILIEGTLEHTLHPVKVMDELWRISKNKALIIVNVPHFSHWGAFGDLTHYHYFSKSTFWHYQAKPKYYSNKTVFKVRKVHYTVQSSPSLFKVISLIFTPLANLSSTITDSLLCKFIPVENIIFELEVIKKD